MTSSLRSRIIATMHIAFLLLLCIHTAINANYHVALIGSTAQGVIKHGHPENQDAAACTLVDKNISTARTIQCLSHPHPIHFKLTNEHALLCSIADGYHDHGAQVAQQATKIFHATFFTQCPFMPSDHDDIQVCSDELGLWHHENYVATEKAVRATIDTEGISGGCAMADVIVSPDHKGIFVSSLGDTQVKIFSSDGDLIFESLKHVADPHQNPTELSRLLAQGAVAVRYYIPLAGSQFYGFYIEDKISGIRLSNQYTSSNNTFVRVRHFYDARTQKLASPACFNFDVDAQMAYEQRNGVLFDNGYRIGGLKSTRIIGGSASTRAILTKTNPHKTCQESYFIELVEGEEYYIFLGTAGIWDYAHTAQHNFQQRLATSGATKDDDEIFRSFTCHTYEASTKTLAQTLGKTNELTVPGDGSLPLIDDATLVMLHIDVPTNH